MGNALHPGAFPSATGPRRARHLAAQILEHTVRNAHDYRAHMDYIHFNPVKHGFVASAALWPFSRFRRAVMKGLYPADWTLDKDPGGKGGEAEET